MVARFVLGTAQIGNRYGITNDSNPMVSADAALILDAARQRGIAALDTAPAYGDSEHVLGECGVQDFEVITKVPALDPDAIWNRHHSGLLSRSLGRLDRAVLRSSPIMRTSCCCRTPIGSSTAA